MLYNRTNTREKEKETWKTSLPSTSLLTAAIAKWPLLRPITVSALAVENTARLSERKYPKIMGSIEAWRKALCGKDLRLAGRADFDVSVWDVRTYDNWHGICYEKPYENVRKVFYCRVLTLDDNVCIMMTQENGNAKEKKMSNVSFDMVMAGVRQVFGKESYRVRVVHSGAYTKVESKDMFHSVTIKSNETIMEKLNELFYDVVCEDCASGI